jgi:CBS domain-containing protein
MRKPNPFSLQGDFRMQSIHVRDLMVPLSAYATVDEGACLLDAVEALETSQKRFDRDRYRHRAVLVLSGDRKVIGKISQLDALKSLEPKYADFSTPATAAMGFSKKFILSIMKSHDMWNKPLADICKKAVDIRVKDIMATPTEGEHIEEEATLDQAIHQLVIGHHQSLLVTGKDEVVGVLRLTDVFAAVCKTIKECRLDGSRGD